VILRRSFTPRDTLSLVLASNLICDHLLYFFSVFSVPSVVQLHFELMGRRRKENGTADYADNADKSKDENDRQFGGAPE